jgi:DNA-binding response OmpR family regulator
VDENPRRCPVVDDERHIVRLLAVNLKRNGMDVTVACGGGEAIEILLSQSFDRVIFGLRYARNQWLPGFGGSFERAIS